MGPEERMAVIEVTLAEASKEINRMRSRVHDLENDRRLLSLFEERLKGFSEAMRTIRGDVRGLREETNQELGSIRADVSSLRRTLLGFAITVAASAIVVSLSVLISTGKLGG